MSKTRFIPTEILTKVLGINNLKRIYVKNKELVFEFETEKDVGIGIVKLLDLLEKQEEVKQE